MLKRFAYAALAAAVLAVRPELAQAQNPNKALVYCPVGIDVTGCDKIVASLHGRFGTIDRAYDGANGTVDLNTVDLHHYSVFIVPSLADGDASQPYARLRAAAPKLKMALNGRVAVYSGSPDQGSSNRNDKDGMITRLASWASDGHARKSGLVGLVVFLDLSKDVASRYDWVSKITYADVAADAELQTFTSVEPLTGHGKDVLQDNNGKSAEYDNMASYGLKIGTKGSSRTVVGAVSGNASKKPVLIMYTNADGPGPKSNVGGGSNSVGGASFSASSTSSSTASSGVPGSGPTLATDMPDYHPGDTVTFTGTGFGPNDIVTITVHEDPTWSFPDRQVTATADGSGNFTNRDLIIVAMDLGATLTATAVADPSGLVAQTTFTDGGVRIRANDLSNSPTFAVTTQIFAVNQTSYVRADGATASRGNKFEAFNAAGTSVYLSVCKTGSTTPSDSYTPTTISTATSWKWVVHEWTASACTGAPLSEDPDNTREFNVSQVSVFSDAALTTPATVFGGAATLYVVINGFIQNHNDAEITWIRPNGLVACANTGASDRPDSHASGRLPDVAVSFLQFPPNPTATGEDWNQNGKYDSTCLGASSSLASNPGIWKLQVDPKDTPGQGFVVPLFTVELSRATTTTLTSSANPSTYGQSATFTATVAAASGDPGANGTVTFKDGVTTLCSAVALTANVATCATAALSAAASPHSITAEYSGATSGGIVWNASPSNAVSQVVNPKTLTPTITVNSKQYDGATTATIATRSLSGIVAPDDVSLGTSGTATFPNKSVATGKTVSVSGLALSGASAANYTLSATTATATADITVKSLTGAFTASDKIYDGNTSATILTRTLTGAVVGDVVSLINGTATFADKNVGVAKTVSGTGFSLDGADAGNYTLASVGNTTASITTLAVTGTFTAGNKVYDGNTSVIIGGRTVVGAIALDNVTLTGGSATFANKNAGVAKTVTGTGFVLSGDDALNYTLSSVGTATADISARALVVSATGINKVYDATTVATVTLADDRISGDVFTSSSTGASFADKNVGVAKTVSVVGIAISGTDAGNYTANTTASTTASITPRAISVTADGKTKVYGDADPALTYTGTLLGSDAFTGALSRASGENVGTYGITLGTLSAGPNYTITYAGADLTITPKAVTVTAAAKTKVYGDADPALTYAGTLVGTDAFTGALTRAAGENIGTYAITQGTLTAGSNYTITYAGADLTITAKAVTITAAAKTKPYGDADPALTYTGTLVGSDAFTGALSRAAGENVGTYAITQGTLTAGSNYTITYAGANLTITTKAVTVTAAAKSKTYGDTDPALTYAGTLVGSDAFTGALSRASGENVGTYAITQGTLSAGTNYTITYAGADLTITPKAVTVTAAAKTKVYGDADPALTYTGVLNGSDAFTGALTRAAGENVGTYAITQGTLTAGSNYTITYAGADLTITAKAVTVTAAAKTKVYGDADPAFTYTGVLNGSDVFTGALSRVAGENVGTYAITQGTLTAGSNYTITYAGANLTITAKAVTVTAAAKTKVYGDADPAFTYTGVLNSGDSFTGALSRVAGENVATYAITQGTLSAGLNYTITYAGADLTITPKAVTVTAATKTKVYGDADPALTYTGVLNSGDSFTGVLSRAAGQNVGTYAITQGTLSAGLNYTITYVGADLTITPKAVTVTAAAKTKVYGDADPALTYAGTLVGSDAFTGALSRAAGENVGIYAITQATLAAGTNYTITYVGADLTITAKAVTVTAAAKTKVYGDADPALTYAGVLNGTDAFTGALTRAAGENVGTYAITQGTVSAGLNYTITYVGADLTVTPKAVTVTAAAKTKVYGDADPALTYTGVLNGTDAFTGALARVAGENVGTYAITQGTLSAGSNYTITYAGANLTITPKAVTVTAAAKTKVYGDADPAFTYTGVLNSGDSFTGALSRVAGENVGTYAITQGTLSAGLNYTITYAGAELTVTSKAVTVTAAAKTKVYGDADPALTYTGVLNGSDAFTGALTRAAGENVGTHAITQGTLTAGSNYTITYVGADLTVTPKAVTVTAAAKTKVYGDADPALTYTGVLVGSDVFTGALSRVAGENVGTYAITQGTLTAGSNYTITYAGANLTITPKAVTVTAAAKTKVYGDADPALTYTGVLNSPDVFTGALTRAVGENVGTYAITQGTVSAGLNYTITYVGADLTITPKAVTVTAAAKTKVYGDADPALTYTGVLNSGDLFTGALTRVTGENVGTYAITQGTVSAGLNYTITYVGADLTITPKGVTVTAAAKTKVYGDADPALTYTGVLNSGDSFTGALTRLAGENVGTYAITQGTLTAGSNYTITYAGANLTITPKAVTVTAAAKTKVYGDADPALTYTGTLVGSDVFTGALSRAAGENVGIYAITQGTLTAGTNYTITYVGADLTITAKAVTVTAAAKTKVYGDADPALTYAGTLVGSDVFTGALSRAAGENVGIYAITQATLTAGTNYTITYVGANLTITPKAVTVTAAAKTKVYGDADPALTYTGVLNGTDAFTGALTRVTGENVGTYAITQGTVSAGLNYTITYVGADLTITPKSVTVTVAAKTKVYGQVDPALTYTGVLNSPDVFTGALSRVAGENVGTYAITQGTLSAGLNYTITYVGADLTITPKTVTVTAAAKTKTYGDVDPALTYTGVLNGTDGFTGALTRVTGENVGTYAITQGTLSAGLNYTITYVGADLTITPKGVTVTAAAKTKVYGDADPLLTYTGVLNSGDSFTGALTRATGESVGTYAITQGNVSAGPNYTITYGGADLTITAKAVTVTAAAKTKVYGDADPALTYTGTLVGSDLFTGALTRATGESVGTYAITQGTVTAGTNYTITYVGANLTITPKAVTVTAAAKTKVYGDVDPALTYTGVLNGTDAFTGALTRATGESVGTYAITQGTVSAGLNYTITYVGADLTITPKAVTVTAAAKTKVYGQVDPALTYAGVLNSGDLFTGALNRVAGENVGTYAITQGTVSAGSNYTITYVGADLTITPKAVTVTAAAKTKVYGDADPALTHAGVLNAGDSFTGALTRALGENVGTYAITQGTLSAGLNYTITYVGADLTITAKAVTVTAAAKTKTYGDADPALTYAGTLVGSDVFTGALTRAAGENVGTYAITQGTVTAGTNYTITYVGANLTITAKAVTVTAAAKTKTYGDADPALTYAGTLVGSDVFTGALTRATGASVGTYAITQGTVTAGTNYTITYVGADLTITPKAVTVTAAAKTKVYGQGDPALTYTGVLNSPDVFTGALVRAAGENVGAYAITQGTLSAGLNYTITYVGADLTITPKAVTVTAAAKTKVYGQLDPALTYAGVLNSPDVFTGALVRAAGENVGTYAITQGTLTAGLNYTITYVGADLTVTPKAVTVTAVAQTKTYGDVDPALTYTGVLNSPDVFTGALSRAVGVNVGTYAITQGTLSAGPNYTITYVGADLTITAKAVTVTAAAKTKTYGDADPALTYAGTLVGSDGFTGALTRVLGENVGTYAITQGTLTAGTNYTITYVGANLTITAKAVTVTAAAKTKTFGDTDPALTYTGTLVGSDVFTGALTRAPGENVGTYAITQGTVTAGTNYTITYVGANLTVTAKAVTVTAAAKTKVYGDADPALTYTGVLNGTDAFTGALTRVAGENVGTYAINQGTVSAGTNYTITYVGANLTITAKAVTVTAAAKTKVYGDADPALTYAGTLNTGDTFTGALTRAAGTNVGTYAITQGTLTAGTNYTITYVGADLTITAKAVTVTALAKTKVFGDADPALTYTGTLVGTDGFTGALSRAVGVNVGTYAISQGTLTAGANYTITYVGANFTITKATPTIVWVNPATIVWPLALSSTQLNAVVNGVTGASLPGTSVYSPLSGIVLTPGAGQSLLVTFTPTPAEAVNYNGATKTVSITVVDNTKPIVTNTVATPNPVPLGTATTVLTATISDATTGGSGISSACYKIDGGTCVPMTATGTGFGAVTVNVTANVPLPNVSDVIEFCVYGKDSALNENLKMDCALIAIYDPRNGFVTGGGWINSPLGAYTADVTLTGKATFGFVSKYENGKQIPTGNTEFQFQSAGFNFKSTVYEWLVIAGARAQYKGSGTINGSGDFSFLLTAIDGSINGGGGEDKFRMKVWNKTTGAIVYDNNMGMDDAGNPTTLLGNAGQGGGSIVIHK